jgi:hypothetical protein
MYVARGDRTGQVVSSQDVTIWPTLRGIYCNESQAPAGSVLVKWHDVDSNEAEWTPLADLVRVESDA